ncbi:PIN domain-containing protein [Frankia sp. Cr2]|uniref:PIN domain-containing protein n=1 Tax=Frankia sp. Cr2 TaxID=3073932 RepID=UPI002AD47443|nr:PIN domain-containing protein [Frankia sp. Cr2]
MPAIIVLDANVLIPNALCDLLLRLAEEDVYLPRWSEEILDEVRRNLPGVAPAAIDRRIVFMNTAFETAMVAGYEHLIPKMTNQVKDRHVLAAAVACDADRIMTCNLRDFPADSCEPHGVEPEHPDDFLLDLWDREPRLITRVVAEQAADTGRHGPRLTPIDVLAYLASAGARRFAEAVRPHVIKAECDRPCTR